MSCYFTVFRSHFLIPFSRKPVSEYILSDTQRIAAMFLLKALADPLVSRSTLSTSVSALQSPLQTHIQISQITLAID